MSFAPRESHTDFYNKLYMSSYGLASYTNLPFYFPNPTLTPYTRVHLVT